MPPPPRSHNTDSPRPRGEPSAFDVILVVIVLAVVVVIIVGAMA